MSERPLERCRAASTAYRAGAATENDDLKNTHFSNCLHIPPESTDRKVRCICMRAALYIQYKTVMMTAQAFIDK